MVNRKGIIFHHDNATPHTSLAIRQKILRLGWEVMLHSPYSLGLAPSDYYFFFLADKDQNFYEPGIMKLPERWQKVIDQN